MTKAYRMFIDDERWPVTNDGDMVIVRNPTQFIDAIVKNGGMPTFITFDHDLGEGVGTGYDIAHLIVNLDMSGAYPIPEGFTYDIHSQNPIGADNIRNLLDNYMKVRG